MIPFNVLSLKKSLVDGPLIYPSITSQMAVKMYAAKCSLCISNDEK